MFPFLASNYSLTWFKDNLSFLIVPIFFAPLFITGFLANLWLIMMILRGRIPLTSSNIYTLSLAFGDLSVFISAFPFMVTIFPITSDIYGLYICKINEFLRDFSVNVTALTLIAMSIDRYFAVLSAVNWMKKQGTRRYRLLSLGIVFLIWLTSVLLALPTVFAARIEWIASTTALDGVKIPICYPYTIGIRYPKLIVTLKFVFLYMVPLTVTGFCNSVIARKLIVNVKSKLLFRKSQQEKALRKARFTARIAFLFVTMFLICFMPHHLFSLWFFIYPPQSDAYAMLYQISRIVAFICAFLDSVLNPIIICSTSYHLKRYVKNQIPKAKLFFV